MMRADLVVVGAGVAGLTAAITAAEHGLSVVVVTKGSRRVTDAETSTRYAQGGIAVVDPAADSGDSVEAHLADTVAAGGGHTDVTAARSIIADGPDAVAALIGWGARFDTDARGRPARTREGGHSVRRIIHAGGDATGAEVQRALWAAVGRHTARGTGRVEVLAETIVTSVIVDGGRAVGVSGRDARGRDVIVGAPTVVVATGGVGQLYSATTNPLGSVGDGVALALRAGAAVADLEFVQFHPTMLYTPGARGRRTLVSEALRGEGAVLVDSAGRSVMRDVHPLGDLAPRDVVSQAVFRSMTESAAQCVHLDARAVRDVSARFPTVTAGVRAIGLDPVRDLIPIVPGAHYLCGGVVTDRSGRTTVEGLYAAGEVARTGLHGANRLASNSLLEGLVMGRRVAEAASDRAGPALSVPRWREDIAAARCDRVSLQDAMSAGAGVERSADGLAAVGRVIDAAPSTRATSFADIEDADATLVAAAVVASSLRRDESRGCHLRSDHAAADDVSRLEWLRIDPRGVHTWARPDVDEDVAVAL